MAAMGQDGLRGLSARSRLWRNRLKAAVQSRLEIYAFVKNPCEYAAHITLDRCALMLEMIQILLFGGLVKLTTGPVSIDEKPLQIVFTKPISALNCSASFNVNISEHITSDSYSEAIKEAKSKFKDGCIKIELNGKEHEVFVIRSETSLTWGGNNNVFMNLNSRKFPTDREYFSMFISSCIPLRQSDITWYNYGKIVCHK